MTSVSTTPPVSTDAPATKRALPLRVMWSNRLAESDLSGTTRAILRRAADFGNPDGTWIKVGVERLAADTGFSERAVKNARRDGLAGGWLLPVESPRYGAMGRRATEFRLALPAVAADTGEAGIQPPAVADDREDADMGAPEVIAGGTTCPLPVLDQHSDEKDKCSAFSGLATASRAAAQEPPRRHLEVVPIGELTHRVFRYWASTRSPTVVDKYRGYVIAAITDVLDCGNYDGHSLQVWKDSIDECLEGVEWSDRAAPWSLVQFLPGGEYSDLPGVDVPLPRASGCPF